MADEPILVYYDANGNPVPEGDPRAVRQFLSDDENRPDAKAVKGPPATKAQTSPTDTK